MIRGKREQIETLLAVVLLFHSATLHPRTIRPSVDTKAMSQILLKFSLKDSTVMPLIDTATMTLILMILALILIFVGKGSLTESVPLTLFPLAHVNATIGIMHGSGTMRQFGFFIQITFILTLVSIRIDNPVLVGLQIGRCQGFSSGRRRSSRHLRQ